MAGMEYFLTPYRPLRAPLKRDMGPLSYCPSTGFTGFGDRMDNSTQFVMAWQVGQVIFWTPRGDSEVLLRCNGQLLESCPPCDKKAVDHTAWPEDGYYRAVCPERRFGTLQLDKGTG